MDYKLIISKDAHEDINDIMRYIVHELKNSQAATGFLDDVEASYRQVIKNPHIYSLCNDDRLAQLGYRKIIIKNYLILYRINEKFKTVYIVRVVYGRQNYQEKL